jgi:hypothetical protein
MVLGMICAVLGVVQQVYHSVGLPAWAWFLISVLLLSVAQFLAFHKVRLQRDKLKIELEEFKHKLELRLDVVEQYHKGKDILAELENVEKVKSVVNQQKWDTLKPNT